MGAMSLTCRIGGTMLARGSNRVVLHHMSQHCKRHNLMKHRRNLYSSCQINQQLEERRAETAAALPDGHGIIVQASKFADYFAEKKRVEDVDGGSATKDKGEELSKTALRKKLKEEKKVLRLEDRKRRIQDRKRAATLAQKRVLKRKTASKASSSTPVDKADVKIWKHKMANELGKEEDDANSEDHVASSEDSNKDPSRPETDRDARRRGNLNQYKKHKAAVLAETVSTARLKQPQTSSGEQAKRIASLPPKQGDYGRRIRLNFDETEILYPPSDVYPPPVPSIYESNPIAAGRAFGILKSCDVEWDTKSNPPCWTKSFRSNEYYEEKDLSEYLDNEQALEYLGDSALHLLSRSLIMDRFPGKTVFAYNRASSWLISNGCFAYMYEDSGLEEERIRVARVLMEMSKKREMQAWSANLTEEQRKQQEETPVGEPALPNVLHLRKADFFEAYVGAVYLTLGFTTASKWIVALFDPWLEAIGRTPAFHQDYFLSASGEVEKRAAIQAELKAAEEKRKSQTWWGRMKAIFFRDEKSTL